MTDGSSSRIVQKYRPRGLSADAQVSVSGLDVSKDKRELLVSYENDQVCLSNRLFVVDARELSHIAILAAHISTDFYVSSISTHFSCWPDNR
jgi:hypothetical protein